MHPCAAEVLQDSPQSGRQALMASLAKLIAADHDTEDRVDEHHLGTDIGVMCGLTLMRVMPVISHGMSSENALL